MRKYREHQTALEALLYFTDCQLATYQIVAGRKRSARSETERHRSIAEKMILACERYGADPATVVDLKKRLFEVIVVRTVPSEESNSVETTHPPRQRPEG